MTADGGAYQDTNWDEARIALGLVSELFRDRPDFDVAELADVPNYQAIPEPVRLAIEDLSVEERRFVSRIFTTLADHHFYLEGGPGPREGY